MFVLVCQTSDLWIISHPKQNLFTLSTSAKKVVISTICATEGFLLTYFRALLVYGYGDQRHLFACKLIVQIQWGKINT